MKRLLAALTAFGAGLVVTWLCGYLNGHIKWPVSQTPIRGCYEIDHCNVPWWIIVWFMATIFGPSALYGVAAFIGANRRWSLMRWSGIFFALTLMTFGMYFGEQAYRAFT